MLALVLSLAVGAWVPRVHGQFFNVTYLMDEAEAAAAIGPGRVTPMFQAIARAEEKIERIFANSNGLLIIQLHWADPGLPLAEAGSQASRDYSASVTVARDKLINVASGDNEPESEITLYEALPNGVVPFRYSNATPLGATFVVIPSALNNHLGFGTIMDFLDGTTNFRPPLGTFDWQFWETKGAQLSGKATFEAVLIHETFHLLGFLSAGDAVAQPNALYTWDLFRFGDASLPTTFNNFGTLPRELRPTQEQTCITALNSTTHAFKMSRGKRIGGDTFQQSHFRAYNRLDPQVAIGIMDPSASGAVQQNLQDQFFTRADIEAMDVIGWNINPDSLQYANAGAIDLVAPAADMQIAQGTAITFEWGETSFLTLSVYIVDATRVYNDDPVRVLYQLPAGTTSATLAATDALPPGEYLWSVTGSTQVGYKYSVDRRFFVVAGMVCDSLDFNQDGVFPDATDIDDFLAVFGGAACPSGCTNTDIDFNNDGVSPDSADITALLSVFGGGPC